MSDLIRLDRGVYDTLTTQQYHADFGVEPSLSSSLAKLLIDKTPRHAFEAHPRLNPHFEPDHDVKFAVGSVAHEIALGKGGGFEILDFADYRKDAAKAARDRAWLAGKTPVLAYQYESAVEMAQAICARLWEIPDCRPLFGARKGEAAQALTAGVGELVLYWRDRGNVLCRAMLDWHGPALDQIWDLKTTGAGLSDEQLARTAVSFGYDLSAAFYLRGLETLFPELRGRCKFRWIFVEDEAPYEVRVVEPSGEMLAIGARKAALAIEKWRRCMAEGEWPGYPSTIDRLALPGWAETRWLEREAIDPDALTAELSPDPVARAASHSVDAPSRDGLDDLLH